MISLHTSVEDTKIGAKWLGIGLAGLICLVLLFRIGMAIKEHFFPTPPPPPTVDFGKIPPIPFPQNTILNRFTYVINTSTGKLPVLQDRAYAYAIKQPEPNLLSKSNIERVVTATEFQNVTPVQLNETDYMWTIQKTPFKRITFNTLTYDFTLFSQFIADPAVLAARSLPNEESAKTIAENFLRSLNSFPEDIDPSRTATTLYLVENGSLVPASSLSTAQVIRVDFYQFDKEKLPIFYPHPPASTINVFVASGPESPQIVEAHYSGKSLTDKKGEYPLKTSQQAYDNLLAGKAFIAAYSPKPQQLPFQEGDTPEVQIIDVSIGYFMADQKQKYLMPVFVFTGTDGFIAYVSAVADQWIDTAMLQ